MLILLILAVLLLAYSNGANDNFKGVATLWSSNILTYKLALILATVATCVGSISAYYLSDGLLQNFSGKGLVPPSITQSLPFITAVAVGASCTVLLATVLGFPISTTHAIVGALVGAGTMAVGTAVVWGKLASTFLLPLLLSPIIATVLGTVVYTGLKKIKHFPVKLNNALHLLSGSIVCLSHGLNDTPKIMSLLLLVTYLKLSYGYILITLVIAIGGILYSRKVANTMSIKLATLTPTQGMAANIITSTLCLLATKYSLPVSFTHISIGAIFGAGTVDGTAHRSEFFKILMSWVLTLPIAFTISACAYYMITLVSNN